MDKGQTMLALLGCQGGPLVNALMNNSSDGTLTAAKLWLSLCMEKDPGRRREDEMTIH